MEMDDLTRQEIIDAGRGHLVGEVDPLGAADDARKRAKENAPDPPRLLPGQDPDRPSCQHGNPVYYEGGEGALGHGWFCDDCGGLLQVG